MGHVVCARHAGQSVSAATNNLATRIASAVVLAPLAVLTAYIGDWPFALFWGLAAVAVLWEWTT
ncbi:MAG: hypothetical protein WB402_08670, partial [Sulfuricaulis sp.]